MLATLSPALKDCCDIDREIGRGGMATVFLPRDLPHNLFLMLKRAGADAQAIVVHPWDTEPREKTAPRP